MILSGLTGFASGRCVAVGTAARILGDLGVRVETVDGEPAMLLRGAGGTGADASPAGRLAGTSVPDLAGLPPATMEHATGLMLAAASLLALLGDQDVLVDPAEVAVQVLLPRVLRVDPGDLRSTAPRVIGSGAVAADLASDEDEAAFARMLESLGAAAGDPEAVAAEAQRWRLPVCAFRPRPRGGPSVPVIDVIAGSAPEDGAALWYARPSAAAPLAGVTVVDMTALWAGPLCTFLLASAGARVHKVEPARRLDGFRDGRPTAMSSPLFAALNRGKVRADLDLGVPAERNAFVELVAHSDLLVTSFSRRVLPNFGLEPAALRRANPMLGSVALHAFALDHAYELALGSGVHAASGLGDTGRVGPDRFAAAVVSYPDPLAGFALFVAALAQVVARRLGRFPGDAEVSLWSAAWPLVGLGPQSDLVARRDDAAIRRLVQSVGLDARGAWERAPTPLGLPKLPHAPFRSASLPLALSAPPDL